MNKRTRRDLAQFSSIQQKNWRYHVSPKTPTDHKIELFSSAFRVVKTEPVNTVTVVSDVPAIPVEKSNDTIAG